MAAEAGWCAADQDMFFEFQHAVYENFDTPYNPVNFNNIATTIGLDSDGFSQCLSNRTHRADVENARRAATRQGISSTPTFFINNRRVEGNQPYEVLQTFINNELAAAR